MNQNISQPAGPPPTATPAPSPAPNPATQNNQTAMVVVVVLIAISFGLASVGFSIPKLGFVGVAWLDWFFIAGAVSKMPAVGWAFCGLIIGGALAFWLDAPLYMKRKNRWIVACVPFAVLMIFAMFLRTPAMPADPAAPPPPAAIAPNFAGSWNSTKWGDMTLWQDGNNVTGSYVSHNGIINGTTSIAADGSSVLNFRWENQSGGNNGVGYFVLAANAGSFFGRYAEGQTVTPSSDDWSSSRTGAAGPPPSFTGTWDTGWGEMHLNQGVKTVTGTYEYGQGTIEGDLNGKVLNFRWLNRATGESGTGSFTLALYGGSFKGSWQGGNGLSSGTAWDGTLQSASQ